MEGWGGDIKGLTSGDLMKPKNPLFRGLLQSQAPESLSCPAEADAMPLPLSIPLLVLLKGFLAAASCLVLTFLLKWRFYLSFHCKNVV